MMDRRKDPDALKKCLAALTEAAVNGERCPMNGDGAVSSDLVSKLAHMGHIRVAIYALNWRVVTILDGPHKGKHTARRPGNSAPPYRVIDSGRVPSDTAVMRRVGHPSAPRPLTKEELER